MRIIFCLMVTVAMSIATVATAQNVVNPGSALINPTPDIPTNKSPANKSTENTRSSKQIIISIIIDDMGYRLRHGKRALRLPANITYSFLPYAPYSRDLANIANRHGKEAMLHIPMQADNGKKLGPGGLTTSMPKEIFQLELKHTLTAIPNIKGMNNHMGSSLTRMPQPMQWLMQSLKKENKYFIDSRTTNDSVALSVAREYHIPSETRDVFLDHDLTPAKIRKQLAQVIKVARRKGTAIAIGHPFPETISVLEKWIPQLDAQGIKLVYVSELIAYRQNKRNILAAKQQKLVAHTLESKSFKAK